MIPTSSSLVAPEFVTMTTFSAATEDKVGIMMALSFLWKLFSGCEVLSSDVLESYT